MIQQEHIQEKPFYPAGFSASWKINKYSLLAHIYFFFNAVWLPKGLVYTTVLSPLFYYNLIKKKRKTFALPFAVFLIFYDLVHLFLSVDLRSFLVSNLLFVLTYFSVISFYHFINEYQQLNKIFRQLLVFNAFLVLIALPFFFAPKAQQEWFWYINKLTAGVEEFPRLALFTYEASYYSLLLIPIWFYYLFKFSFNTIETNKWATLLLITLPMLMSLSFGVIGASVLTALIMCLIFSKRLFRYKRPFIFISLSVISIVLAFLFLWIYFPENAFFLRMGNIISGKDTSANGRTTESFVMAWRIADMTNVFFGAGLGQIKIQAAEVVHKYFKYWGNFPRYDIPNAMGETLAIFGILGLVFRMVLEWYLFLRTKVYTNYYRLALFIFIFIYQFTGSFITNIAEYVIWILAFSGVFDQFNIKKRA